MCKIQTIWCCQCSSTKYNVSKYMFISQQYQHHEMAKDNVNTTSILYSLHAMSPET
jgi:hypothetical protein